MNCAVNDCKSSLCFGRLCRWLFEKYTNRKVLPLIWMDAIEGHEKGILRCGKKNNSYGPHFVGGNQETSEVHLPDVNYHVFKKARISVLSSSVILNDDLVIIERANGPDQDNFNYSSGHILKNGIDSAVVRLGNYKSIDRGFFLGGNGSFNYFHWIVEIIAKSEFFFQLPECFRKYPILVSEDCSTVQSFKETLAVFFGDTEVVVLKNNLSYVVDSLIYINSPNSLPFNLKTGSRFNCSYAVIDRASIGFLRETGLKDLLSSASSDNYPMKIFLARKNMRRNYNQEEIFDHLKALGFEKVFFEDLSFMEQVKTAHHAQYIVGPTGAAWTNLIFCQKGAKALCWMAQEFDSFSVYSTIAHAVGVDLRYLTYEAGVYSTSDLYSKDYIIDPSTILQGLHTLGLQID
ncbi:MAG: glycosyltransferase family 61 protein [Desulfuromusa sp.]|nr:glycosyltransferase family 61 protein [Desulfuromusa sp.]